MFYYILSDQKCFIRNVICSSIPTMSKLHQQVFDFSKEVSSHLIPRTTAYHEIWLDKKLVAGEALKDFEPLYGEFYLPRKVRSINRKCEPQLSYYLYGSSSKLLLRFHLPTTSTSLPTILALSPLLVIMVNYKVLM